MEKNLPNFLLATMITKTDMAPYETNGRLDYILLQESFVLFRYWDTDSLTLR